MTKEKSIDIATQAGIVERGMEAYKAAKERGWVGLSDERLMEMPKQEQGELVAWVDLLKDAEQIIKDKFLYKRFIDGTPLSNDIPCWMVDFAQKYATPQPKQKQGDLLANDPLPRACNLAGVDYQTFLKIKAYMPLYTTPQFRKIMTDSYIKEVIEALYENSDPVSVEAAELLERINAKQEQDEPLAWMNDSTPSGIFARHIEGAKNFGCTIPLYTTPQTKEWVGLTEYEIKGVLGLSESWVGEDCSIPDMIGFAKAIDAKLKEKNNE